MRISAPGPHDPIAAARRRHFPIRMGKKAELLASPFTWGGARVIAGGGVMDRGASGSHPSAFS
jgi:hypothetical protein